MSMKDRSKWLFADCLEDMLRSMDFGDVYVSEICTRCDTNRQNFYYHFHDKYDLAAWLFLKDVDLCGCTQCKTVPEMLALSLKKAAERRNCYIKIQQDFGQTQVREYIHNYNVENCLRLVKRFYRTDAISKPMMLAIHFYSYGMICTTLDWLAGKLDLSAEELGEYQYRMMPDFLREVYAGEKSVRFI